MSKTGRYNYRRAEKGRSNPRSVRHIIVRSVDRPTPDLRKLSRAVVALATAEADAEKSAAEPVTQAAAAEPDTTPPAAAGLDTITAPDKKQEMVDDE